MTYPIERLKATGSCFEMGCSSIYTSPLVGVSKRLIIFINVVFPQPDGPIIAVNLLEGIKTEIFLNASVPSGKRFVTCSKEIMFISPSIFYLYKITHKLNLI